ncbi:MAG: hypothetical protein WBG46_13400 [Nonlabens sp.]
MSRTRLVSVIAVLIFLFFVGLAYINDNIFLEKIIICSAIVGMTIVFSNAKESY